MSDTIND